MPPCHCGGNTVLYTLLSSETPPSQPPLPGLELTPSLSLGRLLCEARPTGQACRKGISGTASGPLVPSTPAFQPPRATWAPARCQALPGRAMLLPLRALHSMHLPVLGLRPHCMRCRTTTGVINTNPCNCPPMGMVSVSLSCTFLHRGGTAGSLDFTSEKRPREVD